eukprot:1606666-Amphidinium_carterae.1
MLETSPQIPDVKLHASCLQHSSMTVLKPRIVLRRRGTCVVNLATTSGCNRSAILCRSYPTIIATVPRA